MNHIERLAEQFKRFPGIGERQAKRFVYYLLNSNPEYATKLAQTMAELKEEISQCRSCFVFFEGRNEKICQVCKAQADESELLIVEKDADYENVKKSGTYKGRYFILGGLVPIVEKEVAKFIRTTELTRVIEQKGSADILKEVILAFSLNPQGEHTDDYLKNFLSPLAQKYSFKISSLGRGLSTGTELEYSDSVTLKNAIKNRQ